mmetsp:Transcript_56146/g.64080  ORF Transcript_56146/g.64080 Transcript_56146/m.64080 type:complete len:339 (+) Transcript_56146:208-1224(+)
MMNSRAQTAPHGTFATMRQRLNIPHMISASPSVTAHSWSIVDGNSGELLWGKNPTEVREIASLTKIMTCLLTLKLCRKFGVDPDVQEVKVSVYASRIHGTSACLRPDDSLTIKDLLYGLMLPSGNDAALCLAEFFTKVMQEEATKMTKNQRARSQRALSGRPNSGAVVKDPMINYFVMEMNRYARELGLTDSAFVNPHGLSDKANRSTASDIGRLAAIAMQNPTVQQVVNTESYTCAVGLERELTWINTNKLLPVTGFNGMKTGTTTTAGPCLSASYEKNNVKIIITVLACRSHEHRWSEVPKLAYWAENLLGTMIKQFKDEKLPKLKVLAQLCNAVF